MRKRFVCLIMLATLLVSSATFFLITTGNVREQDGLLQNSRVYIEDVYVADGVLHYTVVNSSLRAFHPSLDRIILQIKRDGEWCAIDYTDPDRDPNAPLEREELGYFSIRSPSSIPAFKRVEGQRTLHPAELGSGEYRFFLKQSSTPNLYIVGYYTIP